MTLVSLALILLLSPEDPAGQALRARVESAPRKVAAFIERRAGCNHFLGEEPYDRERAAELNRTIRELRCNRVERDQRRLERTYRGRTDILQLLKQTEDLPGW
ncbi:MAG TPA: hypothetical protein VF619_02240 [Allosphingosinicella sp.]|jgi:hypothetical protein